MADNNTELDVTAQPVDGRTAVEAPPVAETPEPQSTATTVPVQETKGTAQASPDSAKESIVPPEKTTFENFKAGEKDPLVGVVIREVLANAPGYVVYISQDLSLHWYYNTTVDPISAAPIFNRACELLAKSEFLRQTFGRRNLISARRLIGQGLAVMFSTQNQAHANAALDTAEKFIAQRGRETSRGWYFGPFFVFVAASIVIGLILYKRGQTQITTVPLVCCLAGGIGAFISTAIGNERIPCAPSAGWILHFLEALLRYTIGFTAGLIVWLATAGNLAIGFLNLPSTPSTNPPSGDHSLANIFALITVALFSGASERLLPSLIARFDDSTKVTATPQPSETETPKPSPTDKPA
jgi:hypothetical protein